VTGALASGGFSSLLQTIVFSRNATGNSTGLLNATANTPDIILPETYANGTPAMLGDDTALGYPTALYP
jgi:osomolarity two-component system, sensor histidine kinase SLN1